MTKERLHCLLEESLGLSVKLVITDNRRNIITCAQKTPDTFEIRVHKMFLEASPKVSRSLASFCKRPTKSNRSVINTFIKDNNDSIRKIERKKLSEEKRITKGNCHDLEAIFKKLNLKYFQGKCTSAYTWGRKVKPKKSQRTIFLGNYDYQTNTIRIHPAMDRKYVPGYMVELTLYHEMLHWYIPPKPEKQRTIYHSRLFRQAEKAHPHYQKGKTWKEKNIHRLLK